MFVKEQNRLDEQLAETEKMVTPTEFQRFESDQDKNRGASDTLAEVSARLGDTGVALQKDLIRAAGSMQAAEGDLDKTAAKPAAADQPRHSRIWSSRATELAQAVEKLLAELRAELQTRIIADLTEMHELQAAIRETTEAQAPRVKQKSRTAMMLVVGLAAKEAELGDRTEQLLVLVEETEFGIALPTSLRVLAREMRIIQGWLKDGRCVATNGQAREARRRRPSRLARSDAQAATNVAHFVRLRFRRIWRSKNASSTGSLPS